ncbi:MAG: hypothetical protein F2839_05255, partial [Actinobacteria bacterium]|nr:hypothetical protein [Actinomycetota bacterium]
MNYTDLGLSGTVGSSYYLTFSLPAPFAGVTTVDSDSFTLKSGPVTSLTFTTVPTSVKYNTLFGAGTVRVTAKDASDQIAIDSTNQVELTASAGTLTGTTSVTLNSGVAVFSNLKITGLPGNFTLTATDVQDTGVTATSSSIHLNTAPTVSIVTPSATEITDTTAVLTADVTGNSAVGSTTVTFCYYASGGSFASCTTVSNPTNSPISTSTPDTVTSVFKSISGLTPGTTYYFRARAINDVSTTNDTTGTFTTSPSISTITPDHGPALGGNSVAIQGSGFDSGNLPTVQFGTDSSYVGTSPSYDPGTGTLTVTAPAHTAGVVDVYLKTGNATTTKSSAYTFYDAPAVSSVDVSSGGAPGGTTVVITGTGFMQDPGNSANPTVTFGGTAASSVTFDSSTQLTVVTPGHVVGTVDIVVTNWDTQTSGTTGNELYEYVPGPAHHITIDWPSGTPPSTVAVDTLLDPQPTVTVRDSFGEQVTNYSGNISVAVAAATPGASASDGETSIATTNGQVTFTGLKLRGTSGANYKLTFTESSVDAFTVTSDFIALTYGPAHQIEKTAGDNQSATVHTNVAIAPKVRVLDISGNPVPGVGVTYAVVTGSGSITSATSNTNSTGYAEVGSWQLGDVSGTNNNTLEASAEDAGASPLVDSPVTFTASGTPGAATKLYISAQPTTATSGTTFGSSVTVQARDAYDNIDTSFTGDIAIAKQNEPTGGGTLTSATVLHKSATAGVATFADLKLTGKIGPYTLRATAASLSGVSADTTDITVSAAAATHLGISTQPSGAASGVALTTQPVIQALDADGNVDLNYSGTVTANVRIVDMGEYVDDTVAIFQSIGDKRTYKGNTYLSIVNAYGSGDISQMSGWILWRGGASTTAGITATLTNGQATFGGLTITGQRDALYGAQYALNFATVGLTGVTSNGISMGHGTLDHLTITSGPNAVFNRVTIDTVTVEARDGYDNLVTGFTGNVSVSESSPDGEFTVDSVNTVQAVGGVATFSALKFHVTQIGNQALSPTFSTSANGGTIGVSAGSITLYGGDVASLDVVDVPSSVSSGSTFSTPVDVQALDIDGLNADHFTGQVTLSLNSDTTPTMLDGTLTLSNARVNGGFAVTDPGYYSRTHFLFPGLKITGPAGLYTLHAIVTGTESISDDSSNIRINTVPDVTLSSLSSSEITDVGATLRASVTSNDADQETSVSVCLTTASDFNDCASKSQTAYYNNGSTDVTTPLPTSLEATPTSVFATFGSLSPSTQYYYRVTAENSAGTSTETGSVTTAPTISSVSPVHDITAGGTTVTITGVGFAGNPLTNEVTVPTTVKFGTATATSLYYVDPTTIQVMAPANAAATYAVSVAGGDGVATLSSAFTYYDAPTVTDVTTSTGTLAATHTGYAAGGDTVVITGTGFLDTAGGVTGSAKPQVWFGDDEVPSNAVTVNSSTQITVTSPAHVVGAVDVRVMNWDTQEGTKSNAFTYVHGAPDHLVLSWVDGNGDPVDPGPDSAQVDVVLDAQPVISIVDSYGQLVDTGSDSSAYIDVSIPEASPGVPADAYTSGG